MKKSAPLPLPPRAPFPINDTAARQRQRELLGQIARINGDYSRRIGKVISPAQRRKLAEFRGPEAAGRARQMGIDTRELSRLKKARLKDISRLVAAYTRFH